MCFSVHFTQAKDARSNVMATELTCVENHMVVLRDFADDLVLTLRCGAYLNPTARALLSWIAHFFPMQWSCASPFNCCFRRWLQSWFHAVAIACCEPWYMSWFVKWALFYIPFVFLWLKAVLQGKSCLGTLISTLQILITTTHYVQNYHPKLLISAVCAPCFPRNCPVCEGAAQSSARWLYSPRIYLDFIK